MTSAAEESRRQTVAKARAVPIAPVAAGLTRITPIGLAVGRVVCARVSV